jgi:hypothetical protein
MDLGEVGWGGVDWICLAEDKDKSRALVIMNVQGSITEPLLFLPRSSSVVLTRLSDPRSRRNTSQKI